MQFQGGFGSTFLFDKEHKPGYDPVVNRKIACEFCRTTGRTKSFGKERARACESCIISAEFEIECLMWSGVQVELEEYVVSRAIANMIEE